MVPSKNIQATALASESLDQIKPFSARLRVLQVNSSFMGGGADNQTLELARAMHDMGDDVLLSVPQGSRWEFRARQLDIPVDTFSSKGPLRAALIFHWSKIIRDRDIQIIHAHQGGDYWPAILAAHLARRGTRVVITRHLVKRPRRVSRWLLLSFADVVAVSRAVLSVLRRDLRGPAARLHQVYCGIDTEVFRTSRRRAAVAQFREQHGWKENEVVFGVVGGYSLPRGKGQLEFLAAAARLRLVYPQAKFAIIGGGTMEQVLQERIAELHLKDIVRMIPFSDEIPVVIDALDVLVHPAVGTDAFPLVVLEAMASSKPVIASRLDGIAEEFHEGEHGLFVRPGDVDDLVRAMRTLLDYPELRRRFGQAGPDHVRRNFSRMELAKRMRAIYLQLRFQQ